ncbi:MAG: putative manganese transporter [Coriobacteriia bacterium]|nr:putative manganese transporter [Coriobacteriia bacterium]
MFVDCLIDAIKDTIYVIPFLLVTYLLMEWIEHKLSDKAQESIKRAGMLGPAVGALLGVIPQCGFSAAASVFYAGRVITLGTLFAVYLSTSDEMIPIFIAGGVPIEKMITIIGIKLGLGMVFGFIVDAARRIARVNHKHVHIHEMCERDGCNCEHEHKSIIKSAIIHTLQITAFIFLITLALNLIIEFIGGNDVLAQFASDNKIASVFVSGLVGLIPNCAASVVIAQLYVDGVLGLGACISGLLVAAGVGILVLLKTNRPMSDNIKIIVTLFIFSIICGLGLCLIV